MLHAEKSVGLVREVTCGVSWWSIVTWHDMNEKEVDRGQQKRAISTLSVPSVNVWIEASKDLVWQRHNRVSCRLITVALTSPVTFELRAGLDLLSPSRDFVYQALPLFSAQHWKAGNGPGNEATYWLPWTKNVVGLTSNEQHMAVRAA